jgi:hypothetical protein
VTSHSPPSAGQANPVRRCRFQPTADRDADQGEERRSVAELGHSGRRVTAALASWNEGYWISLAAAIVAFIGAV